MCCLQKSRNLFLHVLQFWFSFLFPFVFRCQNTRCGKLQPPVISFTEVAFSYSGKKEDYLFSGLNFGIDSDSRIALVGPNGAGKSTLLKVHKHVFLCVCLPWPVSFFFLMGADCNKWRICRSVFLSLRITLYYIELSECYLLVFYAIPIYFGH